MSRKSQNSLNRLCKVDFSYYISPAVSALLHATTGILVRCMNFWPIVSIALRLRLLFKACYLDGMKSTIRTS